LAGCRSRALEAPPEPVRAGAAQAAGKALLHVALDRSAALALVRCRGEVQRLAKRPPGPDRTWEAVPPVAVKPRQVRPSPGLEVPRPAAA
jgi:hypothetical protein